MTLSEYLEDYGLEETKKTGYALIERELERIPTEKVRRIAEEHIYDPGDWNDGYHKYVPQKRCAVLLRNIFMISVIPIAGIFGFKEALP